MAESFTGKRYQCETCAPLVSFDLCETCIHVAPGVHPYTHHFKFVPNSVEIAANRLLLAIRAIRLLDVNGGERDMETGWTRADAELVKQLAENEIKVVVYAVETVRATTTSYNNTTLKFPRQRLEAEEQAKKREEEDERRKEEEKEEKERRNQEQRKKRSLENKYWNDKYWNDKQGSRRQQQRQQESAAEQRRQDQRCADERAAEQRLEDQRRADERNRR
ncbi:unnamed protein product [Didymodactylos carnosus]|uniref:ZZ-type domain-containing protein n=1 Tax=Didymodactylos carnosus TaxID=1234261 RepID=A0A815WED8_9BILA|nr:unnamed protein product [Didymodactylos carnosus]CAF1542878.1 unnamed protein product [Didymodactylos carnosus]CAF4254001.1 unnamed protein product [Didymodactylos carnosus]CAF4403327.1 unnamed protein product [Didymodactylos carnosus]